jgi:peptidyl-prolyl cis-trans isomerase C
MDPAFEEAVFALEPGEVGELVESQYGFHLIKLTERRPARYAPLAEVEDNITALLRDEEKRRRQDQLVAQLKRNATIVILPGLRTADH